MICRPRPIDSYHQGFTLLSDLHLGAVNADVTLIKEELEEAFCLGDRILINGDVFDGILPSDKKRFDLQVLHPKIRGRSDVLNATIDWAVELLAPYAKNIDMIGCGNHDTLMKHHSFDPVSLLIDQLNSKHGGQILYGGYTGFLPYQIRANQKKKARSFVMFYHHGTGHGAWGSVNEFRKFLEALEGVDLLWLAHRHTRLNSHVQRIRCPDSGIKLQVREVRLVRTGGYLTIYEGQDGSEAVFEGLQINYASVQGLMPQGKGGARLDLNIKYDNTYSVTVTQ